MGVVQQHLGAGVHRGEAHPTFAECAAGRRTLAWQAIGLLVLTAVLGGCQSSRAPSSTRYAAHLDALDFSGLKATQDMESLRVTCSPPQKWLSLPMQRTALYSHEQWKSQSGATGVGVVYIHLPLPINAKTLIWFAKLEYGKKSDDGKLLNEWTDDLGRPWFEAETSKYHVRGYAVADGMSAWIVYFGYKVARPLSPAELGLAARCVETVVPITGNNVPPSNLADARTRSNPGAPTIDR
jgi:hypothetical protein